MLGDECAPEDADPYEASIDNSCAPLTSLSQEVVAKKEGPTYLELLDEAIATAAEQKNSLVPPEQCLF